MQLFLRVKSQIRYTGGLAPVPVGIEHQAVWPIIDELERLRGEDCPPGYRLDLFDRFRILEDAAITGLQKSRQGPRR